MRVIPIVQSVAKALHGGATQTSKMPCKSYSLPTVACITGFKMAQLPGSICSKCYANKGFYSMYANTVEPAQHARLDSVLQACNDSEFAQAWIDAICTSIGSDSYFRWHDSGDLQSIHHLNLIILVCRETPNCKHWLPTREYAIVKQYIEVFGKNALPDNLIVRLSAMYPDKPVTVPASLKGIKGIAVSNVHTGKPLGEECKAPAQGGACMDCRACWTDATVSYAMH